MPPTPILGTAPITLTVEQYFAQTAKNGVAHAHLKTFSSLPDRKSKTAAKRKIAEEDISDVESDNIARPTAKRAKKARRTVKGVKKDVPASFTKASRVSLTGKVVGVPIMTASNKNKNMNLLPTPNDEDIMPTPNDSNTNTTPEPPSPKVTFEEHHYSTAVQVARMAAQKAAAKAAPTYGLERDNSIINGRYYPPSYVPVGLLQPKLRPAEVIADVMSMYGRDSTLWDDDVRKLFPPAYRLAAKEVKEALELDGSGKKMENVNLSNADKERDARAAARRAGAKDLV